MKQVETTKRNITGAGQIIDLNVEGLSTLVIELTGTFVGTVVFEYTINNETWYSLTATVIDSTTTATGATATGKWKADVGGYLRVRVRNTAYTSGTINIVTRAIENSGASISNGIENKVSSVNTPSILTDTTGIPANSSRKGWMIQNVGTNPVFIRFGGTASGSVFHLILKGGSADNDGLGASYGQSEGVIFTGLVSVYGTTPKYVVTEY